MKGRQDSVDSQLSAMKRENEVLWREVAILRQKHIKQQQIVNKVIHFSTFFYIGLRPRFTLFNRFSNFLVDTVPRVDGAVFEGWRYWYEAPLSPYAQ